MASGRYDEREARPTAEYDEKYIPNLAIGGYDKREAKPIAQDDGEYIPNLAIGGYDKRAANPVAKDVIPNEVIDFMVKGTLSCNNGACISVAGWTAVKGKVKICACHQLHV